MAIDSFLKLGTLKGESVVKGFEDQIQLLSWGWGMTQSGTTLPPRHNWRAVDSKTQSQNTSFIGPGTRANPC